MCRPVFVNLLKRRSFTVTTEITEKDIILLRERIKPWLSDKRYAHVLSVEEETAYYADIYLCDRTLKVRAAALLHDIAKEISSEKQLKYIKKFDIIKCAPDKLPKPVLHAAAAPGVIVSEFPEFADDEILSAVAWHTTGRPAMTVFDAVIFLADVTEPTRMHESCKKLREFFRNNIDACKTDAERVALLEKTVAKSLEDTIKHVKGKGNELFPITAEAEKYFLDGGHLSE